MPLKPLLALLLLAGTAGVERLSAQAEPDPAADAQARPPARILASEVQLSRNTSELRIELEGGEQVELALDNGVVRIEGEEVGTYDRTDALHGSWRDLLNEVMETPNDELAPLLLQWEPPSAADAGARLDEALEAIAAGRPAAVGFVGAAPPQAREDVAVQRLQSRIEELEALVDELEDRRVTVDRGARDDDWSWPVRYVVRGFSAVLATLALFAVLVAIGFAVVFFGRKYLEGVSDTARQYTLRSWAVGFAATFLTVPVFILGTVALAISIVGIPLLLAWVPLFPVAVGLAAVFGYIAVGHAAGEALAERRLHGSDWYSKGNSYYYVMTGLGLLLVVFIAAHVVEMAGPWLEFLNGLLIFLAIVITWAAVTIGFGAVLLSRAGTRAVRPGSTTAAEPPPVFEEETRV